MSDLQTHYDETHEELAKANQRIAELEYDKKVDNLAIEKMHKRIAELENRIARRDEDCHKLQAVMDENAELEAEIEQMANEYEQKCDEKETLDVALTIAAERIAELEAERDQLGEWTERGNTHVGELVAENERLQAQHKEDADLITEQKREIEVLHGIRDKAEEELNEVRNSR